MMDGIILLFVVTPLVLGAMIGVAFGGPLYVYLKERRRG